MEVAQTPQSALPQTFASSMNTGSMEEEDPYYAKLGEFYTEWITLKEENEKAKDEEDNKPFRSVTSYRRSNVFVGFVGAFRSCTLYTFRLSYASTHFCLCPLYYTNKSLVRQEIR